MTHSVERLMHSSAPDIYRIETNAAGLKENCH